MTVTTTLSEAASKRLLTEYGIPVAAEATAATPDEAAAAATALSFPVVVKLCGPAIAHKTERRLLRLGLTDAAAVQTAATELLAAAGPEDGPVELLVAVMVRGTRELIAGVHRDPQFGPCVMIGMGGVLAEAVADVAFGLAPLTRVDAEDMIGDLQAAALLGPFRGEPAVDRAELAEVLLGLSRLVESEPTVRSVDVNPLIVVDGRAVAVDALAELSG